MHYIMLLFFSLLDFYIDRQIHNLGVEKHEIRLQAYNNLNLLGKIALDRMIEFQNHPDLEVSYKLKKLILHHGKFVFAKEMEKCKDFSVSVRNMYGMHSGMIIHSTKTTTYIISSHYLYVNLKPPSIDILYKNKPYPAKIVKKEGDLVLFSIKLGNVSCPKLTHSSINYYIGHYGCSKKGSPVFRFGNNEGHFLNIDIDHGDIGTGLFFLENYKNLKCFGLIRNLSGESIVEPSDILKFVSGVKW